MAFLDFLFGKSEKLKKVPTLSPQQSSLLNQLLGQVSPGQFNLGQNPLFQSGSNYLQNLLSGSPEAMQQFEAPFMRQFQERTIPALAERFSSVFGIPGASGAQSSSAFQQALGQQGAALSENLASLRGQLGLSALPQALGFSQALGQMGLGLAGLGLGTPSFAYQQRPASGGLAGPLLSALGQGFGMNLGSRLGGMGGSGGETNILAQLLPLLIGM